MRVLTILCGSYGQRRRENPPSRPQPRTRPTALFASRKLGGWLHSYAYVGEQGWDATVQYWEWLMRIHFANTGGRPEFEELDLLTISKATERASSFAYGERLKRRFENYWNELVNIHLAGANAKNGVIQSQDKSEIESHLITYADKSEIPVRLKHMNIHLTDTTATLGNGDSIKPLIPKEGHQSTLFSSAYPEQEKQWAQTRPEPIEEDMHIHIAGHSATPSMEADVKPSAQSHLTTYADQTEVINTVSAITNGVDLRPRVIIDSGAFTAWTTGKTIHPKDYAEWALEFEQRWRPKMAMLEFMNLDVIGDQDGTWQNQAILEGLGMKPLPIVTYGVDLKHLDRALKDYDYIALGGLVPYTRQRDKLRKWLDACFARVMKYRKKTGTMRRVHLLGVTTDWVLKRYPCYSSDSSSWVSCLRFGGGKAAGLKQLPRYKESDAALSATIHTLRSEIRKYKKMEAEATKLWKSRGVTWND